MLLSFFKDIKRKRLFAIVVWFLVIISFSSGNLVNPNLWFDEALQFWSSKGQHRYSDYDTPQAENLSTVIESNYTNTWDPAGFTILLHFLGKITNKLWIFRSLTLLFILCSALLLSSLASHWQANNILAYFSGLVLLLSAQISHYAFEIRPYSMELLHSILAVYIVCRANRSWSITKSLLFGVALAITMASRYTTIFPAFFCTIFVAFKFFQDPEKENFLAFRKREAVNFLALFLPSIIIGIAIVFMLLKNGEQWQNANANDAYHLYFMIFYRPTEVFNFTTLLLWAPLITLLILRFAPIRLFPIIIKKYDLFLGYTLALNIFRLFLDLSQFTPYTLLFRFNLPCLSLLLFTYFILLQVIFEYNSLQNYKFTWLNAAQFFCPSVLVLILLVKTFTYSRIDTDPSINYLRNLPAEQTPKILAHFINYPVLRYAFEYGDLKERINWRENIFYYFRMEQRQPGTLKDKFDFLILNDRGELDLQYYQLALNKGYTTILERHIYLGEENKSRPGYRTVIVELR